MFDEILRYDSFDFVEFAGNECNEQAWRLLVHICESDAALCKEMYRLAECLLREAKTFCSDVYLPRRDYFWTAVRACVCSGKKRLDRKCLVKEEKRAIKEYHRRLKIVHEKA